MRGYTAWQCAADGIQKDLLIGRSMSQFVKNSFEAIKTVTMDVVYEVRDTWKIKYKTKAKA